MSELKLAIMTRDELSEREAERLINEAKNEIQKGADPEEILEDYFGLEPDYIFDLL